MTKYTNRDTDKQRRNIMLEKLEKSLNETFVLANVLKNVYKSSQEDGENVTSGDIINMLNLIIEKLDEIKNLCINKS